MPTAHCTVPPNTEQEKAHWHSIHNSTLHSTLHTAQHTVHKYCTVTHQLPLLTHLCAAPAGLRVISVTVRRPLSVAPPRLLEGFRLRPSPSFVYVGCITWRMDSHLRTCGPFQKWTRAKLKLFGLVSFGKSPAINDPMSVLPNCLIWITC